MGPTLFISAGEASGEHYGALLIEELKRRMSAGGQTGSFFGMGGERMVSAGLDRVVFRIDGWDDTLSATRPDNSSPDHHVWIAVNRSWRAAWR